MEAFLQFAGMAGLPTSFIGVVLFLYFTIRKQEAVVRTEQLEQIERQKKELADQRARNDELEQLEIDLRRQLGSQDAELRKVCADKDLEIAKLQIELLHLGWEEEQNERSSPTNP